MNSTLNNNPNDFRNWKDAVNNIYGVLHNLGGSSNKEEVNTLIVEGVNDTTTAVANYGINVIETASATDFCCRLPLAETGKSVIIINKTLIPITVFPSVVGGDINGNVNGSVTISQQYVPYTFYCIVNPLPGSWVMSSPLSTTQIGVPNLDPNTGVAANYLEMPHTNGVLTKAAGWETGVFKSSPTGLAVQGTPSCGYLFGNSLNAPTYMRTETSPTRITKVKLYSNVVAADLVGIIGAPIIMQLSCTFLDDCNSGQSTFWYFNQIEEPDAFDPNVLTTEITNGMGGNVPIQVGDNTTMYNEAEYGVNYGTSNNPHFGQIGSNIGLVPGGGSDYWWCPYFEIQANMPTKNYQFKIIIEVAQ